MNLVQRISFRFFQGINHGPMFAVTGHVDDLESSGDPGEGIDRRLIDGVRT